MAAAARACRGWAVINDTVTYAIGARRRCGPRLTIVAARMADEMFRARVDAADAAAVVVHVDGEVDLAAVEELRAAIDEARATPGAEVIELDLSGVTFIDSSGIGAIVMASRAAADANQSMRIGARSPVVERVLEVSGLEEALRAAAD